MALRKGNDRILQRFAHQVPLVQRALALISLISLAYALILIILTPAATGYELDIYEAIPYSVWVSIIISLMGSYAIIALSISFPRAGKFHVVGMLLTLLSFISLLIIPLSRGYYSFGRGDVMTHLGYIVDILNGGTYLGGRVGVEDSYPLIHLIGSQIVMIGGIDAGTISFIVPIFFTTFFSVGVYLMATYLSKESTAGLIAFVICTPLLYRYVFLMYAPSAIFLMFFPILMGAVISSSLRKDYRFVLLSIFAVLLAPLLHPGDGTLVMVMVFVVLVLWKLFSKHYFVTQARHELSGGRLMNLMAILVIAWIALISTTTTFSWNVTQIWSDLVYGNVANSSIASSSSVPAISSISNFFDSLEPGVLLLISVLVLSIIPIVISVRRGLNVQIGDLLVVLGALFLLSILLYFYTPSVWLGSGRILRYFTLFLGVVLALVLFGYCKKGARAKIGVGVLMMVIILPLTLGGLGTIFFAPSNGPYGDCVSRMEVSGMDWVFESGNTSIRIDEIGISQVRFSGLILGTGVEQSNVRYWSSADPPRNFGYGVNDLYGESYSEDRYLVCNMLSGMIGSGDRYWNFTRLNGLDPSVSRVYSNGEFWGYYIDGRTSP